MLNAAADNHNHMIGFNYDAAGNLTKEGSGTPSWNYSWDAENRLSSISGSAADTFTYDGDGNMEAYEIAGPYAADNEASRDVGSFTGATGPTGHVTPVAHPEVTAP